MKKIFFTLLGVLLFCIAGSAQIEAGVMASGNLDFSFGTTVLKAKNPQAGYSVGLFGRYLFPKTLQGGLLFGEVDALFTSSGTRLAQEPKDLKVSYSGIDVPLLVGYRKPIGNGFACSLSLGGAIAIPVDTHLDRMAFLQARLSSWDSSSEPYLRGIVEAGLSYDRVECKLRYAHQLSGTTFYYRGADGSANHLTGSALQLMLGIRLF